MRFILTLTLAVLSIVSQTHAQGSCGIPRGNPVYGGCGYIYQTQSDCQTQCGANSCSALNFIPAEGSSSTGQGSCGIARGASVYSGCGIVYQAQANAQQECGQNTAVPFIPTTLDTQISCGLPRGYPLTSGCGYIYQSPSDCQTECGADKCSSVLQFVPAEGGAATGQGSCGITRGANVWSGCGFAYQSQANAQQECGTGVSAVPFITNDAPSPTPVDTQSSCGIPRGNPVYSGCGYIYQTQSDCQTQCGNSCSALNFIPAEGSASTGQGSCGIARGMFVYSGCGLVYQSPANAQQECGGNTAIPFIPTTQDTKTSCGIPRGNPVYSGCGFVYQTQSACSTQCGADRCSQLKFIPAEGTSDTTKGSCGITRGANVYTGCGYAYQADANAQQECKQSHPMPFIPSAQ